MWGADILLFYKKRQFSGIKHQSIKDEFDDVWRFQISVDLLQTYSNLEVWESVTQFQSVSCGRINSAVDLQCHGNGHVCALVHARLGG